MNEENMYINNRIIIDIKLEGPYFQNLCAQDKAFTFKIPFLTEEEIQTGKCDRIQSVEQLLRFIREVETVEEQEGLLYELLNKIRRLPDLSELESLHIEVNNTKKDGNSSFQQLDYSFITHEVSLS